MNKWDKLPLVETMNYCKSDLKTGKPLVIANIIDGLEENDSLWMWDGFDKSGNPVRFKCEYIKGKKDKSGARVKLEKYT